MGMPHLLLLHLLLRDGLGISVVELDEVIHPVSARREDDGHALDLAAHPAQRARVFDTDPHSLLELRQTTRISAETKGGGDDN